MIEWQDMLQAIGLSAQHDNRKRTGSRSTLERQIFVHSDENVEFSRIGDVPQQPAVFDARPSGLEHRRDLMARQSRGQPFGEALIKENAHSGWQKSVPDDRVSGFLKEPNGLFS